nr:MAG TPA: hypothetical protein [Bacteriophage sp.]
MLSSSLGGDLMIPAALAGIKKNLLSRLLFPPRGRACV